MSKLIAVEALLSVELDIKLGTPTVDDVARLINSGKCTFEIYEPLATDKLSVVIRPNQGEK